MVDELYTEGQQMFRDAAREFAQSELAPNAGQWDRDVALPDAVVEVERVRRTDLQLGSMLLCFSR